MKIKKILQCVIGLIAFFPVIILLTGVFSNKIPFFGFPPLVVMLVLILFMILFINLILYVIVKAVQINKLTPVSMIFFIYLFLAYTLAFSVIPTPTFCRTFSSNYERPSMRCGYSILDLNNWKNKTLHIEWNRTKNWLVGDVKVYLNEEKTSIK
ncbi:MAG: hypothetical protein M0P76_03395 [Candidatus Pacebacteria bacterium]|jgi:amino acid transporter|nr:hypothetical protein [Candidatus Paceibacterota bacterium]